MADKDRRDEPSLEMPSLGDLFRRSKRSNEPAGEPTDEPSIAEPRVDEPAGNPEAEAVTDPPQPAPEPVVADPPPGERRTEDQDPTTILDEPATVPLYADEAPAASAAPPSGIDRRDTAAASGDAEVVEAGPSAADSDGRHAVGRRPRLSLPAPPGRAAVVVTGLVIGLLAVGATYLALRGCELARGTSSCGGPGLFLLLAILVLLVVLGGAMLRMWGVGEPMSTSFLAVGLVAVVALLFLIDVIFSPWMLLVVPAVSVATFLLSHWVTTAFVEEV